MNLASFRNASVSGTFFVDLNAGEVDFTGATLTANGVDGPACLSLRMVESSFVDALLSGVQLNGSDFTDSDLEHALLVDVAMSCPCPDCLTECLGFRFNASIPCGALNAGVDFEGTDLSGAIFENVHLRESDFTGAMLNNASFIGSLILKDALFLNADLSGATFSTADLSQANLSNAFLSQSTNFHGATLSDGTTRVNLACDLAAGTGGCDFAAGTAQFRGANMSFVNLTNAGLAGADLRGTILKDTVFRNADLSGADFSNSDLSQGNLSQAFLSQTTNFVDAMLSDAPTGMNGVNLACDTAAGTGLCDFTGTTQFAGANLQYVDLTNAGLAEADLRGTILDHANLTGAVLNNANLACDLDAPCGSLDNAVLNSANLSFANLTGASLTGALLQNAILSFAYMPDADLTNADLTGANLEHADFYTIIGSPSLEGATLFEALFGSANLIGLNLNQAKIEGADFGDAQMLGAQLEGITSTDTSNRRVSFVKTLLAGADFSNSTFTGGVFTNAIFSTSNMTPVTNSCTTPSNPRSVPLTVRNSPTTEITQCYNFAPTVRPLSTSTSTVCPDGSKGPCITDAQWIAEDPPIDEGFNNPNVW